ACSARGGPGRSGPPPSRSRSRRGWPSRPGCGGKARPAGRRLGTPRGRSPPPPKGPWGGGTRRGRRPPPTARPPPPPPASPPARPLFPRRGAFLGGRPVRGAVRRPQRRGRVEVGPPVREGLSRDAEDQVEGHLGDSLAGAGDRPGDVGRGVVAFQDTEQVRVE